MKKHFYNQDILSICNHRHLTVDDIFEQVKNIHPEAGKSSIYRNVEELCQKWLLKKIEGVSKKAYFEKMIGNHAHLVDEKTGAITDLDFSQNNLPFEIPKNFSMHACDIRIFGNFI